MSSSDTAGSPWSAVRDIKFADGTPVSASVVKDKFSNTEFGAMGGASVGLNLHRMISSKFGLRGEFQITESLIMSDFVRALPVDLEEAYQCGLEAVELAEKGESGYMVTIVRSSDDPYCRHLRKGAAE